MGRWHCSWWREDHVEKKTQWPLQAGACNEARRHEHEIISNNIESAFQHISTYHIISDTEKPDVGHFSLPASLSWNMVRLVRAGSSGPATQAGLRTELLQKLEDWAWGCHRDGGGKLPWKSSVQAFLGINSPMAINIAIIDEFNWLFNCDGYISMNHNPSI